MIPKAKLMRTPGAVFASPTDVVDNLELSREQKVAVLRQWKDEIMQRQAAEAEAMPGSPADADLLQQIADALLAIDKT